MNNKARVKLLVSLSIVFSLAILILFFIESKPYQILELKALDWRFSLKGEREASASVVHIDIDDQSLVTLGRWPWPRRYHAKVVSILKECQAKQIVMDVLFTEELKDARDEDRIFAEALASSGIAYLPFYFVEPPSAVTSNNIKALLLKDITISPETAAIKLGQDAAALKEDIHQVKRHLLDEAMHDVLREDSDMTVESLLDRIEGLRGWFLFPEDENYIREHFLYQKASRIFFKMFSSDLDSRAWLFKEDFRQQAVPILPYVTAIKGAGYINAAPDIDGVTRRVPLFLKHEDRLYPQLTMAALMDSLQVRVVQGIRGGIILKDALVGSSRKDIRIPVDKNGAMLINWAGRWGVSFKHLPYYSILRLQEVREQLRSAIENPVGPQDPQAVAYLKKTEDELLRKLTAMVKDKVCIIGLTATGTNDLNPVPLQEDYPMVGTHANLINTILNEDFIRQVGGAVRVGIFFLTAFIVAMSSLMKLWKSFFFVSGYALIYFFSALFLFIRFGLWIDLVGPFGVVVFGFTAITSFRFFTEEKEKLWIKQAFGHYLSSEVISELMENPDRLKLGGERRMLTVLFSDVRGFTSFSESRQPEEVVGMLNQLLTAQVDVVFKHGGTLDKFVGDELMAFFGAPGLRHQKDHALVAVRVAVEIQTKMREVQEARIKENKTPLQIGIGINTGEMVVGNMGSSVRMDYTVIGDNVNLGARLCSAAGKDEIIISEATYLQVVDYVHAEKLDPVSVKGKVKPISIYKVTSLRQPETPAT